VDDYGMGVSTDRLGNIYITGYFESPTIIFGSYTLSTAGSYDIFIVKYNSSGNVLWAKSAGGSGIDIGNGVATDDSGNVYVTGIVGSVTISFGSYTLNNSGGNTFLVKYDSSGNVQWAKCSIGNGNATAHHVAADSANNVYLTGSFCCSPVSFGSDTLTNYGNSDAFFVKFNSLGNVLWCKNITDSFDTYGYCVATDKTDKIYVTGSFHGSTLTLDTIRLQRQTGSHDPLYLAEFDSSGNAVFAKALTAGGDDQNAVAVSSSGCVYVGGDYDSTNFVVGKDTLVIYGYSENVFVAKLCYAGIAANFACSDTVFCSETGKCISFIDHSSGNPTSWHWTFTGAVPDTSSLQNPDSICYSTPGTYPVTLIVSNGTTSDTITVSPLIIFGTSVAQPTITVRGGDTLVSSHGSTYQWYLNGNIIAGATDSFYVEHQSGTYSVQISDVTGGCHALSSGVAVGIIELSGGGGISIFPNPFDDLLTIQAKSSDPFEIVIYDIASQKIIQQKFTGSLSLNLRLLAKGVYIYEVKNGNGVIERGKIVKD
jgi:PKD repeat protein